MTVLEREQIKNQHLSTEEERTAFGVTWVYNSFYGRWETKDSKPDCEGCSVRCGCCGCGVFKITYGSCECIATCTACASTCTVYDG